MINSDGSNKNQVQNMKNHAFKLQKENTDLRETLR